MGPRAPPNVEPVAQFISEPWFLVSVSVYQEITEVEPSAKSTLQFSTSVEHMHKMLVGSLSQKSYDTSRR